MKKSLAKKDLGCLNSKADELIELIDKANESIRIFTGEGLFLYNYPTVISAFERAKQRNPGMKIQFLISSIMFVAKRTPENSFGNGLIELSQKGVVELYRRIVRTPYRHYCLVDGGSEYFCECSHSPLTPLASLRERRLRREKKERYCGGFDEMLKQSHLSKDPLKDFIFLTYGEIKSLFQDLDDNRVDYNNLTYAELQLVVEERKKRAEIAKKQPRF